MDVEDEMPDYDEREYSRIARQPEPDFQQLREDAEEQWLLDRIAENEQAEMYEGMAEEHAKEMAAEEERERINSLLLDSGTWSI